MNYSVRASLPKSHLQGIEHQLRLQVRCHRPAHDPPAERIEHDREKEKSGPRRHVGDISDPELVRLVRSEVPLDKIRSSALGLRSLRRDNKAPAAHTSQSCHSHEPRHTLPANALASISQIAENTRCAVRLARSLVARNDLGYEKSIVCRSLRYRPFQPRVVSAARDAEHAAQCRKWEHGLVIPHEPEDPSGIVPVSLANQAAAFDKMSRSSLSCLFSRLR